MFWENLRTLYYLTKYNNIKSVGFLLKIHPSTITRRIKQLEGSFKDELFSDYKKLTLSIFGETLMEYLYKSCENLERLENKTGFVENLYKNNEFIIYITDVYYYNVLIYMYENKFLCKSFFNIRYISVISYEVLRNVVNSNSSNFLYITGDDSMFTDHKSYISMPVYDIPVYLYENLANKNNHIMKYSGEEKWLKDLYKNYNYRNKDVTNSNSIHILSKLIHCVGEGILPSMYNQPHRNFKKTKIGNYKLMLVFNKENKALQTFFAFNTVKNN